MRKPLALVFFAVALAIGGLGVENFTCDLIVGPAVANADDSALAGAFSRRAVQTQVDGLGTVVSLLPDDNDGSRHQRFIVRLNSGQTILIAHNIDLAAHVSPLREGDVIGFRGDYEWNSKGGVVHWTHRDPAGRHPAGWLKHNGKLYQ